MAFDKSRYDIEYAKEHITRKYLAFNRDDEEDCRILAFLEEKGRGNVNAYIKNIILEDMKNSLKTPDSLSIRLSDRNCKP